jgi:hypothetical protein
MLRSVRVPGTGRLLPAGALVLLVVVLLAGLAWAVYSYAPARRGQEVDSNTLVSTRQRLRQEQCLEAAVLFHDVRWAAACAALAEQGKSDGLPECELPDTEAQRLYALLDENERRCMADGKARR